LKSSHFTRIGVIGAGQLGRMLALAGYPLGLSTTFLDRRADTPGAAVAPIVTGDFEDPERLAELAARSDVLTFDWENFPAASLQGLRKRIPIRPSPDCLQISQDRVHEKALFTRLKIPVAAHAAVGDLTDLCAAMRRIGTPGVLKTRRLGYDGKGQVLIRDPAGAAAAVASLGGCDLVYERLQRFTREVSIIGARSSAGRAVFYPLAANTHAQGILRFSVAPYVNAALERTATVYLKRVMNALDYVGVLALEFFVVGGRLVANEMAPRVHNSGHWTIEGCVTSQFENHVRAVSGLPLGSTRPLGHAAMINFLGTLPDPEPLLRIEGLAYHDYGKVPRPGRKLGHCTILKSRAKDRNLALENALKLVGWT
jgi:5-(carboxyamino)imidazole ribonucleotide synthase